MDSRFPAQQRFSKVGCDLPQQSNNVPISNNPTKG
ncbi:hypothetical protein T06_11488 [Trichinella sp. T6]|nr:hypothetical protein T06_11488 [Trichinella sp. T6]